MNAIRTVLCLVAMAATAGFAAAQGNLDHGTMWLASADQQAMAGVDESYRDADSAPARDIRVQVWHGRDEDEVYDRGDELEVFFRTNDDLYVVVYRVDAEGFVEVLWPTSRYDDGFVYAGHDYRLPPANTTRRLRVSHMKGVEYIEAIASEYPFDLRDLAIDFRFADERGEPFDYAVDGDPFLAINDINYAITGLEEDAPYIVTDFSHLYVEDRVEYARYSCRQCHVDDDAHHAYVHNCTEVVIRYDFGWYDRWYLRYGWYPIYYDPFYTVWDVYWGRPYYYWNYPIYYSWPSYYYGVYTRPYPVYVYDRPVRYKPARSPLYERPDGRDRLDRFGRRDIARIDDDRQERREIAANRPTRLADNERPRLESRRDRDLGNRIDRRNTGPNLRRPAESRRAPDGGRLTAQRGRQITEQRERLRDEGRSIDRKDPRGGDPPRRWTRPVLRNRVREEERPRGAERPEVDRPRTRDQRPRSVDRAPRTRTVKPRSNDRKADRPREIRRPDPPKERPRANPPRQREVKRDDRRSGDGKAKPAPRSAPPKQRGGGKSRGKGSRSGSNGGGG